MATIGVIYDVVNIYTGTQ